MNLGQNFAPGFFIKKESLYLINLFKFIRSYFKHINTAIPTQNDEEEKN